MILRASFIFTLSVAMLSRSAPKVVDITKLSTEKKTAMLAKMGLSSDFFDPSFYREMVWKTARGVFFNHQEFNFVVFKYDKNEKEAFELFKLHRSLHKQLQQKVIFNEQSICFSDGNMFYFIYKYKRTFLEYGNPIKKESLKVAQDCLLSVVEIARSFDQHGGSFSSSLELDPLIFVNDEIKFSPTQLMKLHPAYNMLAEEKSWVPLQKRMHFMFFYFLLIDCLRDMIHMYNNDDFRNFMKEFSGKNIKLLKAVRGVEGSFAVWDQYIKFIRSWENGGRLSNLIEEVGKSTSLSFTSATNMIEKKKVSEEAT